MPKRGYYPTEASEIITSLDQDCQKEVNSLEVRPILGEVRRYLRWRKGTLLLLFFRDVTAMKRKGSDLLV